VYITQAFPEHRLIWEAVRCIFPEVTLPF